MIPHNDYKILSDSDLKEYDRLKSEEVVGGSGSCLIRKSLFYKYPKSVRHNIQLFPNHYLDIIDLNNTKLLQSIKSEFIKLFESDSLLERNILNYINKGAYYFIIGSLLKKYFNFGHHEAHVFREFPLGTSFKSDYLIVGKNSDGWHFVFIELEAPYGKITLKNGDFGEAIRKGKSQIEDWDHWLDRNFSSLQEYFFKHTKQGESLPNEFCCLDKSRINYVVVAGRRKDFSEKTYRIQRNIRKKEQVYIIHYDNVFDAVNKLIGSNSY